MAKKVDTLKAKEKKQKIVAAVGGVILLIVLGIQGPTLLKQLSGKPSAAAAPRRPATTPTGTTPGSTVSLAPPTLQGAQQPAGSGGVSAGTDSSAGAPQAAARGQLASFSEFASKDPFAQQLSMSSTSTVTTATTPSSGSSGPGITAQSPSSSPSAGATPAPGSAVISVNGTLTTVTVGTDFPQASASLPGVQPFFHLVSLTAHTAKISVARGSYTSGVATVTLRENKPVTLVNTADGTRYRLILKPQGTAVPPSSIAPSGTSTTTTSGP